MTAASKLLMAPAPAPSGAFDPLADIAWAHAYWAEGPEFVALSVAPDATVGTWPDEIGTADLTQGGGTQQPIYKTTAGPGGVPSILGDGTDVMSTTFTTLTQPNTIVFIGKCPQTSGNRFAYDGLDSSNRNTFLRGSGGSFQYNAGTTITAATADTNDHLWVTIYNGASSDSQQDGTSYTGSAGTHSISGLRVFANNASLLQWVGYISFLGVYDGTLSAGDITALETWATSHYGITIT